MKTATCKDCGVVFGHPNSGPTPKRCDNCKQTHLKKYKSQYRKKSRLPPGRVPPRRSKGVGLDWQGRYCRCSKCAGKRVKIYGPNRMYRPECHQRMLDNMASFDDTFYGYGVRLESPSPLFGG